LRYGIVGKGEGLPPAAAQRAGLKKAACEVVIDSGLAQEQRKLVKLLPRLGVGDEVLTYRLELFERPAGELVQLIRHMTAKGAVIRVDDGAGGFEPVVQSHAARQLVELLAGVDDQLRARPNPRSMRRETRAPLSCYQIEYARKLYRQGSSLRSIGLLFQLPPNEILGLISEARP
jgi:DNA invertase Pin-like site-specific DNA recombinase